MKYFTEEEKMRTKWDDTLPQVFIKDDIEYPDKNKSYKQDGDRVLTVHKNKEGLFIFREACDEYFILVLTKEQAFEFLDELKEFIKNH